MKIKDMTPKQGSIEIEADVIEKAEVREFQKFGKPGRVCTAVIQDETGKCNLSLWNEQVDQVNVGDRIRITNGYANEWQGNLQLTTGRMGTLEIVGKASESGPDKTSAQGNKKKDAEQPVSDKVEEEFVDEEDL